MNQSLVFFKNKLTELGPLYPESWKAVENKAKFQSMYVGQHFEKLGDKAHYFVLVCEGLLKEYDKTRYNENYISRYLLPGSVCIAVGQKFLTHLEAITNSKVLILTERTVLKLSKREDLRKSFSLLLAEYMAHRELKGIIATIKPGPLKYERFYDLYPEVCLFQPLSEQADFLGVSKDTVYLWRSRHRPKKQ